MPANSRSKKREEMMKKMKEEQSLQKEKVSNLVEFEDTPLEDTLKNLSLVEEYSTVYTDDAKNFVPYPDESIRLQLHTGYKRDSMKESIIQDGIIEPVLVWNKDGKKIILAGHNRVDIAKELNIKVPYIEMNDIDTNRADRIVVVTNLQNRQYSEMKPSEISRMLSKLITTYDNTKYKQEIYKDIDGEFNLSKKKVIQYLRLKELIPELLELLDNKKIGFNIAYALSGTSKENQKLLISVMNENNLQTIQLKQAQALLSWERKAWTEEFIKEHLGLIEKPKKEKKITSVKIPVSKLSSYMSAEQIENAEEVISESVQLNNKIREMFQLNERQFSSDVVIKAVNKYLNQV